MKGLRVPEIAKKKKFERVWGELESKKSFQTQLLSTNLRLTLVFM